MIVNKLLHNLNDFLKINNLNKNIYPKNDYELLIINDNLTIFYIIIFFIIILYLLIYNKFNINYLFYIIFTYIILKIILEYYYSNDISEINNVKLKKNFLNKLLFDDEEYEEYEEYDYHETYNNIKNISYFNNNYILINFFWDIKKYIEYSRENFRNIIVSTNLLLKYYYRIIHNIDNINKNNDNFNKYFKETLNNFQSLIYSIPITNNNNLLQVYTKNLYNILGKYKFQVIKKTKNNKINLDYNINTVPFQKKIVYASNEVDDKTFDIF